MAVEESGDALPIRSGGRWAMPSGIETRNSLPLPGGLSTRTPPAVQPSQLLYQRQSDSGTLVTAAPRSLDAMEPIENMGQGLPGDAKPGVADRELGAAIHRPQPHRDFTVQGKLECV